MQSVPNAQDKIKDADVVVRTNHVTFLINRSPRQISLPTSAIFVSGTSGITTILKYKSVNPLTLPPEKPEENNTKSIIEYLEKNYNTQTKEKAYRTKNEKCGETC